MIGVIHRKLHLQHARHTGSVLHHRHTSFRALLLVMLIGGVFIGWFGQYSRAQALDLQVTARRNAPVPDALPFVGSHATGFETLDNRIEISGTCPTNTPNFVKIFNWSRLIGTVPCNPDGTFKTKIWIVYGNNRIQVSSINTTGQETNRSVVVVLRKVRPARPAAIAQQKIQPQGQVFQVGFDGAEFDKSDLVNLLTDKGVIVYTAGESFEWPMSVVGGRAPYSVRIDWGDGNSNTYNLKDGAVFTPEHTYTAKKVYEITVTAKDADGRETSYIFSATTPILLAQTSTKIQKDTTDPFVLIAAGRPTDQALLYATYALVALFVLSVIKVPTIHTEITHLSFHLGHHKHRHRHG
jgi:hypothetical protein